VRHDHPLRRLAIVGLSSTLLLAMGAFAADSSGAASTERTPHRVFPRPFADGWRVAGHEGVRGITIGPIENGYHPNVGYGSEAYARTLDETVKMGARWVSITPFGRVADLSGRGVDPTFERPVSENREHVRRAIEMAHARGLSVMLVPHLWVESGAWRAEINPVTDEGWAAWARSYGAFVRGWAEVAEQTHVELLSAGVELRSWVTTSHAPSFVALLRDLRAVYHGPITYSANWDDVDDTRILRELDVIGINAFYPLADKDGAPFEALLEGGKRVRARVHALSELWQKPVLFTEVGYTTRPDPAIRPWEWPDNMKDVRIDEPAQADAYRALLAPLLDEPFFMGFFVWRVYADPDDVSQEAGWGFSPRGKLAELVMRDAFATTWASDVTRSLGWALRARAVGLFP
jgi:hypothetical protein